VLPVDIGNAFVQRAQNMGWHLRLRTDVAETEVRPPHRVLLAFSPTAGRSALATDWSSVGQSSSIPKDLPL
jgi:tRNA1Val (adenine37-N6)-methyltransferase